GWIEIGEAQIAVNIAKATGATLHLSGDYDAGELGENVADDALLMAAPAFANVGQFGIASRLIAEIGPRSHLLADPAIAASLQAIMGAARRVRESLELADALDRSADPGIRETSIFFTLPALRHSASLTVPEKELQKKTLRRRIVRRRQAGDGPGEAREKVNLANLHRGRGEGEKAIRLYREAAEADPDYLERAYYWRELGGVLWMGRRYGEAAEAYEKAISLGAPPITGALHADSVLFTGRYRQALEELEKFNAEHPDLAAEYRLKEIALRVIVEQMGIETQERDTDGAVRASPDVGNGASPEQVIEGSLTQLRLDALWPSAWYNVGIAEGRRGDGRAALKAFLAATTMMPGFDLEPWSHAAFWAWRLGEADLLRDILATARRLAGAPILAEMIRFGRSQDEGLPRDGLLEAVGDILDEMPPDARAGYTIRVAGPDGVEEFEVGES
ncbi:MAG TPA: tetratricopeptide repeat protein, partial [Solirubrobacterales bacterium]|nr:tetratricopeptide repeat protein [Solirubrobacterales bacterium]